MFFLFLLRVPHSRAQRCQFFPDPLLATSRRAGEGEHLHRSSRAGQRACFRAFCQGPWRWRPCSLAPERWLKTTSPPSGAPLRSQGDDFFRRVFLAARVASRAPPDLIYCIVSIAPLRLDRADRTAYPAPQMLHYTDYTCNGMRRLHHCNCTTWVAPHGLQHRLQHLDCTAYIARRNFHNIVCKDNRVAVHAD